MSTALHALVSRDACETGNSYDGRIGLRISAVFVIGITSIIGTMFPIIAKKNPAMRIPSWSFFFAKYFGSGVIIATAFIHLLGPANEALSDTCLTGPITEYSWAEGISLMAVFSLFFIELLAMRYATFSTFSQEQSDGSRGHSHSSLPLGPTKPATPNESEVHGHLSHERDHTDIDAENGHNELESYAAQLTALFILEFGVIFHSIFIGLTLAVSGDEFTTLYIVLVFHQTFEGLGLGSRLAVMPWPASKAWTPWVMALAYGLSTPIAIAIGLGVRTTYPPGGSTTLIINGVFDSVSAGILLYTGLVELMAHEFLFSHELRNAPAKKLFLAFLYMVLGAGLMALLGKWA